MVASCLHAVIMRPDFVPHVGTGRRISRAAGVLPVAVAVVVRPQEEPPGIGQLSYAVSGIELGIRGEPGPVHLYPAIAVFLPELIEREDGILDIAHRPFAAGQGDSSGCRVGMQGVGGRG